MRREGFLWVCKDGSTLRRPAVTASPFESWSKTAPMSEVPPAEDVVPFVDIGGGGGTLSNDGRGGGGGGAGVDVVGDVVGECPDWTCRRASNGSMPSWLFQVTPVG